jgi:hypothetical protein
MRRTVLLALAALACALPAPAAAAPRATDFQVPVRTDAHLARAAGAHATWTSPVIRPGRTFHVFGLKWTRASGDVHAEVRVAEPGRPWRRWTEISTADAGGRGSDPVWAGGADRLQIRLTGRVEGLRVHFVRVTGARTPRPAGARAAQATGQPTIIPREEWAGSQCNPRRAPSLGTVQVAFIHHTVSANDYGRDDAAAMILGICRFHRNGNGWDDVGYNFFVDKYGQIFEGRAGGIDQPVVGAQAQGWNAQSTGIANLGTYGDRPQSEEALEAMARLIAWKLPLHGVPVTGTVSLVSAGGETNRVKAGAAHTFHRISGHRDGNSTECPGAALYAQLPRLREMAEARAPDVIGAPQEPAATLTLAAPRLALAYPEPAELTGTLTDPDGAPLGGVRVRIQVLTATGFKAVTSAVTGPDGVYTARLSTSRNRTVRALAGSVTSNTIRLTVAPALRARVQAARVPAGRRADVRGTVRPMGKTIAVQVWRKSGSRYVLGRSVRTTAKGASFRVPVRLARPGLYRLRVRAVGDGRTEATHRDLYVRALRPRR